MNNQILSNAIIRQRGQLTIPDNIRQDIDWLDKNSVITIVKSGAREIKITPYNKSFADKVNWKEIWDSIKLVRSLKGKRNNLSKFIIKDRLNH